MSSLGSDARGRQESVSSEILGGREVQRERLRAAACHSVALATACVISYWLTTHLLARVHSLSTGDDLLGGLWSVVATVFVYRETHRASVSSALSRASATLLSFALCLGYLLLFPFHVLGLAALISIGTFALMATGRDQDVVTAGITTAVIIIVAAVSPHHSWEQPILRLADTALGIAVGVGASSIAVRVTKSLAAARARRVNSIDPKIHAKPVTPEGWPS